MKKFVSFLLLACFSATLLAQTIVSTNPSNRNFLLEEYTGTNCVYCPDGHKIAQGIMTNNQGRAWAINIHQGGFSGNNPDYKTDWGNALANQYGINSYPNGTCNRGTATVPRNQWVSQCASILSQSSCVNVAAQGTVDWNTRQLSLLVEVYYTGNAANSTNKLNVVLMQNNIMGPQTGGAQYYPEMMEGGLYRHMHMLRDLITGQWGMDIPNTTSGTFWSHTFEYTIPEHVRNVPILLEDIEIIVFVAENQKTIISGNEAVLSHTNLPAIGGRIDGLTEIQVLDCSANACTSVKLKNIGQNAITSVELSYTVAGGAPTTFVWDARTIASMTYDTIQIPFQVQENQNQVFQVELVKVNSTSVQPSSKSLTVKKEIVIGDAVMTFVLTTDRYATETRFYIYKPDGTILIQGGPWPDLPGNGTTVREFEFIPPVSGCYRVEVTDSYGDGINAGYGAGNVKILDGYGNQIFYNNGQFGSKLTAMTNIGDMAKITATAGTNGTIYPETRNFIEGASATYTFTPDEYYEVEEVFIDGEPMGLAQATEYTFPVVDKDYIIHVTFKEIQGFTITASAGENGAISPNGETTYSDGASATYTFTPNANYEVEEVIIDGTSVGMAQATEYTFTEIDKDHTIHVTFKLIQEIKDVNGVTISVAPNPVNDELFVTGTYDKLELYSMTGQILLSSYNQPIVDVNHLTKGIYFVKIQSNGQTCTFKVIK